MKYLALILFAFVAVAANAVNPQKGPYYLYCHMSGNGQYTAFAVSKDGLNYQDILNGDSIFSSHAMAGIEGGTRDAYICRSHDMKRYLMVTTDMNNSMTKKLGKVNDWDNYGINLLTSDDLINWKSTTFDYRKGPAIFLNPQDKSVYNDWSTINRVWAPQIFWDETYVWPDGKKGGYFIYYSMWNRGEEAYDRMYYSYADESFTRMTQPQLLFDWGYATIDADINYVPADGLFHMMIKKEGGTPGLFTATAKNLRGPWGEPVEDDYVNFEGKKKCEGVSAFQIDGEEGWRIAYIEYSSRPRNYRICKADKYMRNFSDPQNIKGVTAPQHGSFMKITKKEYKRLLKMEK
ncbi:MAG: glycoside hydrolase family 43 protein [Prevotella sp.]|nr:glycoside hydrolase family 43 protein [Candidatus Prevotella equi]